MVAHFVYHVTLRMPTFISHVSIDLYELFEDCAVASCAFCGETCRIVEMAINVSIVLVV